MAMNFSTVCILTTGLVFLTYIPGAAQETAAKVTMPTAPAGYILGPGDQFSVEIPELEELNGKTHRIDNDGTVTLPLLGRVQAAGLTLPQFEAELDHLLLGQLREPYITVTVTELQSRPITVLGEVNTPGTHQIRGPQSLAEVLSLAGGLKSDAGYKITITRKAAYGGLPLSDAQVDPINQVSTGEVNVSDILEGRRPSENIDILPYDLITVPRARVVYVMGEVHKPGGFTLDQRNSIPILQVLALAEGLTPSASKQNTIVIREKSETGARSEIHLDLRQILKGKGADMALQPDDILFVPNSTAHTIRTRALEAAIATGTGILIWRGL
ncbi:MAG TPA: polysaccharide biosynthesis/export family protein [Bryobacteraceae bacterium]|jgi:polysaccharide export outer membrane protein